MDKNVSLARQKWANIERKTQAVVALIENGTFSSNDLVKLGSLIRQQSQVASYLFDKQTRAMQMQAASYAPEIATQLRTIGIDSTEGNISVVVDKVFSRLMQKSLPALLADIKKAVLSEGTKVSEFAKTLVEERDLFVQMKDDIKKVMDTIYDKVSSVLNDLPASLSSIVRPNAPLVPKQMIPATESVATKDAVTVKPQQAPAQKLNKNELQATVVDTLRTVPHPNPIDVWIKEAVEELKRRGATFKETIQGTEEYQQLKATLDQLHTEFIIGKEFLAATVENNIDAIKSKVAETVDDVKYQVARKIEDIKQTDTYKKLKAEYDDIRQKIDEKYEQAKYAYAVIKDFVGTKVDNVSKAVQERVDAIKATVSEKVETVKKTVADKYAELKKQYPAIQFAEDVIVGIKDRAQKLWENNKEIFNKFKGFAKNLKDQLKDIASDPGELLSTVTSVAFLAPIVMKLISNIDWAGLLKKGFDWLLRALLPDSFFDDGGDKTPPASNAPPKTEGIDAQGRKTTVMQDDDGVFHSVTRDKDGKIETKQTTYNPLQVEGDGEFKGMIQVTDDDLTNHGFEESGRFKQYYDPKTGKLYEQNEFDSGYTSKKTDVTEDNKKLVDELNAKYGIKPGDIPKEPGIPSAKPINESVTVPNDFASSKVITAKPATTAPMEDVKANKSVTLQKQPATPQASEKPAKGGAVNSVNPDYINLSSTNPLGMKMDDSMYVINSRDL